MTDNRKLYLRSNEGLMKEPQMAALIVASTNNSQLGYNLDLAKSYIDDMVRVISFAHQYSNENQLGYVEIFDIST